MQVVLRHMAEGLRGGHCTDLSWLEVLIFNLFFVSNSMRDGGYTSFATRASCVSSIFMTRR